MHLIVHAFTIPQKTAKRVKYIPLTEVKKSLTRSVKPVIQASRTEHDSHQ